MELGQLSPSILEDVPFSKILASPASFLAHLQLTTLLQQNASIMKEQETEPVKFYIRDMLAESIIRIFYCTVSLGLQGALNSVISTEIDNFNRVDVMQSTRCDQFHSSAPVSATLTPLDILLFAIMFGPRDPKSTYKRSLDVSLRNIKTESPVLIGAIFSSYARLTLSLDSFSTMRKDRLIGDTRVELDESVVSPSCCYSALKSVPASTKLDATVRLLTGGPSTEIVMAGDSSTNYFISQLLVSCTTFVTPSIGRSVLLLTQTQVKTFLTK